MIRVGFPFRIGQADRRTIQPAVVAVAVGGRLAHACWFVAGCSERVAARRLAAATEHFCSHSRCVPRLRSRHSGLRTRGATGMAVRGTCTRVTPVSGACTRAHPLRRTQTCRRLATARTRMPSASEHAHTSRARAHHTCARVPLSPPTAPSDPPNLPRPRAIAHTPAASCHQTNVRCAPLAAAR